MLNILRAFFIETNFYKDVGRPSITKTTIAPPATTVPTTVDPMKFQEAPNDGGKN